MALLERLVMDLPMLMSSFQLYFMFGCFIFWVHRGVLNRSKKKTMGPLFPLDRS